MSKQIIKSAKKPKKIGTKTFDEIRKESKPSSKYKIKPLEKLKSPIYSAPKSKPSLNRFRIGGIKPKKEEKSSNQYIIRPPKKLSSPVVSAPKIKPKKYRIGNVKPKQEIRPSSQYTIKPPKKISSPLVSAPKVKPKSSSYRIGKVKPQQTREEEIVKPEIVSQPIINVPRIAQPPKIEIKPKKKRAYNFRNPTLTKPEFPKTPGFKSTNKIMPEEEEIIQREIPQRTIPLTPESVTVYEPVPFPVTNREYVKEVFPIPEYHESTYVEEVTPIPEYHESTFVEDVKPIPEYHEYVREVQPIPEYHYKEIRPTIIKDRIPRPVFIPAERPEVVNEEGLVVDNKIVPRIVDTSRNYKDDGEVTVISPFSRLIIKSKEKPQSSTTVGIIPIYSNIPTQIQELFISTPEMNILKKILSGRNK